MDTVRVVARPRIHVGLVDLSGASWRSYGGVGFALNGRHTIWRVEHAEVTAIDGTEHLDLDAQRDLADLEVRLRPLCRETGYRATLEEVAQQHIGLGTKTTLCMSLISAVNSLKELNLSPSDMIVLSGRGGASGIGTNLFFIGGVVWDGGHSHCPDQPFMPSGAQKTADHPPLLARWEFPSNWRTVLMLPKGRIANGEYEREFFRLNTPLPKIETLETMAIMYHGIIPGIATTDMKLLRSALLELHNVGFKNRELMGQPEETRSALAYFQTNADCPIGMSSMGPLLYAIVPHDNLASINFLRNACGRHGLGFLGAFDAWNSAHETFPQ
jgi:beta-ribofuranosylaminobenzene 5'-phosphate synthase